MSCVGHLAESYSTERGRSYDVITHGCVIPELKVAVWRDLSFGHLTYRIVWRWNSNHVIGRVHVSLHNEDQNNFYEKSGSMCSRNVAFGVLGTWVFEDRVSGLEIGFAGSCTFRFRICIHGRNIWCSRLGPWKVDCNWKTVIPENSNFVRPAMIIIGVWALKMMCLNARLWAYGHFLDHQFAILSPKKFHCDNALHPGQRSKSEWVTKLMVTP